MPVTDFQVNLCACACVSLPGSQSPGLALCSSCCQRQLVVPIGHGLLRFVQLQLGLVQLPTRALQLAVQLRAPAGQIGTVYKCISNT